MQVYEFMGTNLVQTATSIHDKAITGLFSLLHVLCSELMSVTAKPCSESVVFALSFLSLWLLQSYSPSIAVFSEPWGEVA